MAITRIAQFHAETQNISELIMSPNSSGATSNPSISTQARTGGRSVNIAGARRPWGFQFTALDEFRAGVWFKHPGVTDVNNNDLVLFSFGTDSFVHYNYPENTLEFSIDDTEVSAYTSGFMRQMVWMHLGLTYKSDLTNGFCSFYIDGKQIFNYTGPLGGGITQVYFGGVPGALDGWVAGYWDDFYLDDTTGEADNPPPSKRFLFSFPNAAGNDTDWTPTGAASNFQAVDEAPPDGNTSYVEAASTGLLDTYNLAAVTMPNNWDPVAVIAHAWAAETNGNAEIDLHLYDGAYAVGDSEPLTVSYARHWHRFATRPSGGDWDAGSIDTIQMGYERTL